ncbi:MAG TPA: hypothetical protein VG943_10870 [Caulobacterales bacterium]|nr:hypothetical protein [Caulobacterales bacterium]
MAEDVEEVDYEWDEVLIEMRRFAIEQAIALRAQGESLDDVFKTADRIIDYITQGSN